MENLILYTVPLEKERIGKPFDGGYIIYTLPGTYDICISGGIANDISFEQAIVVSFHPHHLLHLMEQLQNCLRMIIVFIL